MKRALRKMREIHRNIPDLLENNFFKFSQKCAEEIKTSEPLFVHRAYENSYYIHPGFDEIVMETFISDRYVPVRACPFAVQYLKIAIKKK